MGISSTWDKIMGMGGGFGSLSSNNNRKMTKGRIAAGKSTFKGTQAEHQIVKLEKKIKEKARMMIAVDIKLDDATEKGAKQSLKEEKDEIEQKMMDLMDEYNLKSSDRRYNNFIHNLDEFDQNMRELRGIN